MFVRATVVLASVCALQSCAALAPQPGVHKLFPAARYVKLPGVERRNAEYLVEGVIESRDSLGDLPWAVGPLQVDCRNVEEIGMMVRPANWSGGGYYHMYTFSVASAAPGGPALNYFSYRKMMLGGYVRGAVRFKEMPDNGIVTLTVAHRGEDLLSTDFEFFNCR